MMLRSVENILIRLVRFVLFWLSCVRFGLVSLSCVVLCWLWVVLCHVVLCCVGLFCVVLC
jgi:hypothetical protein